MTMMSDGSPPSSWYDPPEPEFEINFTEPIPIEDGEPCDGAEPNCKHDPDYCDCRYKSCEYTAVLSVELLMANRTKTTRKVCGLHAFELFEIEIDDPQFSE